MATTGSEGAPRLAPYGVLVLVKSDGTDGKSMPLRKPAYSLGSDPTCEVQLKVEGVDPIHARILRDDAGVVTLRCMSADKPLILAGTLVNKDAPATITFGSTFKIESKVFRFDKYQPLNAAATAAPAHTPKRRSSSGGGAAKSKTAERTPPPKKRKSEASGSSTPIGLPAPAVTAPAGYVMRFMRTGTVEREDVHVVTELCRKYHIAHGPVNDLISGRQKEFRNWHYLGLFNEHTNEPAPADVQPIFTPPKVSPARAQAVAAAAAAAATPVAAAPAPAAEPAPAPAPAQAAEPAKPEERRDETPAAAEPEPAQKADAAAEAKPEPAPVAPVAAEVSKDAEQQQPASSDAAPAPEATPMDVVEQKPAEPAATAKAAEAEPAPAAATEEPKPEQSDAPAS